jgi:hypothetical protein
VSFFIGAIRIVCHPRAVSGGASTGREAERC